MSMTKREEREGCLLPPSTSPLLPDIVDICGSPESSNPEASPNKNTRLPPPPTLLPDTLDPAPYLQPPSPYLSTLASSQASQSSQASTLSPPLKPRQHQHLNQPPHGYNLSKHLGQDKNGNSSSVRMPVKNKCLFCLPMLIY